MRDHIITEAILRDNGIFEHCMYCSSTFDSHDEWQVINSWFQSYLGITCSTCKREHRFKVSGITIEDLLNK